jgi:hypothetical protein
MKNIIVGFLLTMFLGTGLLFCSQIDNSDSARASQDSLPMSLESSRSNSFSRSRSGSIVSKLRLEIENLSLRSQVVDQACSVAQEKLTEQLRLKKRNAREKRYSFMEPDPK